MTSNAKYIYEQESFDDLTMKAMEQSLLSMKV